jgi:tRNA(Ser,Leu) C12 N-acetylase TAN1
VRPHPNANASLFPRPIRPPPRHPLPHPLTADAPARARRRIDGADVAAKRRKTSAGDDPIGEEDVSLERYEYAAPSAILSGDGACGFAITCAFNREKSATKEAMELIRPHLPDLPDIAPRGLRLNPVKTPGRGFIFIRLSPRPAPSAPEADDDPNAAAAAAAAAASSASAASAALPAVAALARAVRTGDVTAPKWVEKILPVQLTCRPDEASLAPAIARAFATSAALDESAAAEDARASVAVSFRNRFRRRADDGKKQGEDAAKAGEKEKGTREDAYAREMVVPAIAAAAEAAVRSAGASAYVNLKDPDVVVFAEVVSVPEPGGGEGRFAERLALGVVPRRSGVFEVRKKGIVPVSLKRTGGG